MNTYHLQLAAAFAIALFPGVAMAQHEGHQAADGQALPDAAQCARVQPVVDNIIAAATARLETARLSNNPTELRAAVEQFESALRDLRAQLAPCAAITAATSSQGAHSMPGMQPIPEAGAAPAAPMDHSKMPMGGTPVMTPGAASGTKPPMPAAPMDHSKMPMGSAPATRPGSGTGAKPPSPAAPMDHSKMPMGSASATKPGAATSAKPASPAAPMDHSKMPMGSASATKPGAATGAKPASPAGPMDHSKMPMGAQTQPGKAMDPVTGLMVDPSTAPKTTYQGQTYYFSSEQTRKEFLENPAKFSKKPKG